MIAAVAAGGPPTGVVVPTVCVVALLAVQLALVRPILNRRSDRVLAGESGDAAPRSRAHLYYVALEILKVVGLIALGVSVLTR